MIFEKAQPNLISIKQMLTIVLVITFSSVCSKTTQTNKGSFESIFNNEFNAQLVPSDSDIDDEFGLSVSLNKDKVLVGAVRDNDLGTWSGSAYIFEFDGLSWVETQKLNASNGIREARFGDEVILTDLHAIISAPLQDNGEGEGFVYVYEYNGDQWVESQILIPNDSLGVKEFGESMAISGNRLIIGAGTTDQSASSLAGAAYIFEYNGSTWVEMQKLTPSDGIDTNSFGTGVGISGDLVLVGDHINDIQGGNSGAVYAYEYDGQNWNEIQKFVGNDTDSVDLLGANIVQSGKTAAISSLKNTNGQFSGAVYVFQFNNGQWTQSQKIIASDGAERDFFGSSLELKEGILAIGAFGDDVNVEDSGAVYLYENINGYWEEKQKLTLIDEIPDKHFGTSVSISNNKLIVGAPSLFFLSNSGSSYIYSRVGINGQLNQVPALDFFGMFLLLTLIVFVVSKNKIYSS